MKQLPPFCIAVILLLGLVVTPAPARAEDGATAKARERYQDAQKQFDLGNWDAAIQGFASAYELRPDPIFLYNMAQAYRRSGNLRRAIDLYKNYLIKDPKSPQRAEVEDRIRALRTQIEDEDAKHPDAAQIGKSGQTGEQASGASATGTTARAMHPPAAIAPPPPEPAPSVVAAMPTANAVEPAPATEGAPALPGAGEQSARPSTTAEATGPAAALGPSTNAPALAQPTPFADTTKSQTTGTAGSRGLRIAGLTVGAAGVVSAGLGAFFSYRTRSLSNSVSSAAQFNYADVQTGKRVEIAQWICYGAAAALVATGAVLYWRGRVSKGHEVRVGLAPMLAKTAAGLLAAGSFQ